MAAVEVPLPSMSIARKERREALEVAEAALVRKRLSKVEPERVLEMSSFALGEVVPMPTFEAEEIKSVDVAVRDVVAAPA
jgi:hypothetical protein